ncbi:MAG: leucine-rich repeat domain-containing protein [Mycoplasmoidaceae bacterium]|nr:leucine-rich repeat domain-containing protein [Mycoplasmoidaceae bacterium]
MVFDQSKGVRVLNGLKRPLSCYDGFTSICIPADVFYIADNAFESSADDELPASIKTIEFDDNVIEEIPLIIGKSAFANSAYVEKFVFPQRLKYVCDSGFAGCISAKTIDISQWDANDVTSKAFPFASEHVFDG